VDGAAVIVGAGLPQELRAALRIAALAAATLAPCAYGADAAPGLPTYAGVRAAFVSSEARLYDRHGEPLAERRIDRRVRRLDWVGLEDISPAMSSALIAAEDRRFLEHHGVDWQGLAGAAWDSIWRALDGRRVRGGSTLTMQLAGLLDPALAPGSGRRTLEQKWDQARMALALEQRWSKREILEAYLNLVPYRGELVGLDAAAHGLFGKAPAGLDAREAAVLVALLRGTRAPAHVVAERACAVAAQAAPEVACAEIRALASATLAGGYRLAPRLSLAPHLAVKLLARPGERVQTTLDAALQRRAIAILADRLAELAERGVEDGALVVLDNASGDVLAYVGSSGELSDAAHVDGVVALRQAGSTLKPFLYAVALDTRLLTAASLVEDSPLVIATERGLYAPQDYEREFHGLVSVRAALGNSLNIPAVRTLGVVGLERFAGALRRLGFDTLTEPDEHYGAALALGGADVTLLALANAYRALANGGVYTPARVLPGDAAARPQRVFGAAASYVVADILADRSARALTFGLENPLAARVWAAVKTGTSKDMRDNWCVGFTSRYTIGVWVGNFSGAPMRDVSGVTGAAPVLRDLVDYLHAGATSAPAAPPPGLARLDVRFEPAVERARSEWFLRGTEMAVVRAAEGGTGATPRIRYPAADTVIAIDPDLPPGRQRVPLEAAPGGTDLVWRLDGAIVPGEGGRASWVPRPGRHRLVLEDAQGRVLAHVAFEVRGDPAAMGMAAASPRD
jgi:penicillin-binding protein 1C